MRGFAIVLIGSSLGGLRALEVFLEAIPRSFFVPIAIVQHREEGSDHTLCTLLQSHSAVPLREAEDKDEILPGHVYIAPAGYHLLVERGSFALSTEAPLLHSRPSIDILFESAADTFGERAIGVILTGASADGAQGLARIKERGGLTIVQDPSTAESSTMPEAAIAGTQVDRILPISEIASFLVSLCNLEERWGDGKEGECLDG